MEPISIISLHYKFIPPLCHLPSTMLYFRGNITPELGLFRGWVGALLGGGLVEGAVRLGVRLIGVRPGWGKARLGVRLVGVRPGWGKAWLRCGPVGVWSICSAI